MAFFTNEEITIYLDDENLSANEQTTLSFIISACEQRMKSYCNRDFEETTYEETYNGNGKKYLNVNQFPVTSVVADIVIVIDDNDAVDTTDDDIFKVNKSIGKLYCSSGFTTGFQNVDITYKAGYVAADLPEDLKYALLLLIQSTWNKFKEKSSDVAEYTAGDITKKYQYMGIPIMARKIFDSYRMVNV